MKYNHARTVFLYHDMNFGVKRLKWSHVRIKCFKSNMFFKIKVWGKYMLKNILEYGHDFEQKHALMSTNACGAKKNDQNIVEMLRMVLSKLT